MESTSVIIIIRTAITYIHSQTSIIRGTWAYYILVLKTADNRGVDNGGRTVVHVSWA